MRPLHETNPDDLHPRRSGAIAAFLVLSLGTCALVLANGAAPELPWTHNPAAWLSLFYMASSLPLLILPRLLRWEWEMRYFALGWFGFSAIGLLAIVPLYAAFFHSSTTALLKAVLLLIYAGCNFWWCRRFVRFYSHIWQQPDLRRKLYHEDDVAAYYSQRGDEFLYQKKPKFKQLPDGLWLIVPTALALITVPFYATLRAKTGLPFTHIFLLISGLPMSMMATGVVARCWLICFHYPAQIRKQTGKLTYVDIMAKIPRD